MTEALWKLVSIILLVLVVTLAGTNAYTGWQLIGAKSDLADAKVEIEKLKGENGVQSEKVAAAGRESEDSKKRYERAMALASAKTASTDSLSKQLSEMVKGKECKDAMPVVNRVIEATR